QRERANCFVVWSSLVLLILRGGRKAGKRKGGVVSDQWSVVSGQWSVVRKKGATTAIVLAVH
ncbi:MAG: hypothetical protein PHU85_18510, partial [Phycisphaerae bacterium]|nr:hypothetical protein [Phycisphaerae bacterium]